MSAGDWSEWVGRTRAAEGSVDVEHARRLAATLDVDPQLVRPGWALPHGWHWAFLTPADRRSELAVDGHAERGGFLPPIPLERRMWAGGRLSLVRPLLAGSAVRRTSRIESVTLKEGRSGPLAFVTVSHRLEDAEGVLVDEEQDLVYLRREHRDRDARRVGPGSAPPATADEGEGKGEILGTFVADAVTLFRFSAVTFNGHRIHYDHPYATGVEGYPDLVVHGPLLALLLLQAGERRVAPREATPAAPAALRFAYRGVGPAFRGETIQLIAASGRGAPVPGDDGGEELIRLRALVPERGTLMRAELRVERGGRAFS